MDNPYTNRLWQPSQASQGFDWKWYTGDHEKAAGSQVWDQFKKFKADRQNNIHFADYVRANAPLEAHWQANWGPGSGKNRWDWGKEHYDIYGQHRGSGDESLFPEGQSGGAHKEGWFTPQIIAKPMGDQRMYMDTIMTRRHTDTANEVGGLSPTNLKAFQTYAQRHFETEGKGAGLFGSHAGWYNSPGQQAVRASDAAAATQLLDDQRHDEQIAARAESDQINRDLAARSRRIKTRGTVSAGGTGSFRARGLTTSENKRGGGANQFRSTNPYFQATLNTGTGKGTGSKSTLNV